MLEKITTQSTYKILAVSGLIVAVLVPYFCWHHISDREQELNMLFEQRILNQLDLESTQAQIQSTEYAIAASRESADHPNAVEYSPAELEQLQIEVANLKNHINQLTIKADSLATTKKLLVFQFKLTFVVSIVVMSASILLTAFGLLGWYFHIRIYQERRTQSRAENSID